MRYGSLFTGIGGIDLGLDMAGMECAWQVEVDDYCTSVLEKRWPDVAKYRDIFELNAKELEPVDLICGGFPCQPVSVAGRRAGTSDERWIWGEFARIIRQVKPRWVVAENVTGLLSANAGRAFAEVLRDLAESRYNVVWDVFPAGGQGGVGAPHKRQRIFIIAKLADSKSERHGRRAGEKRRIKERELQQKEQGRSEMGSKVEGRSKSRRKDVADPEGIGVQGRRPRREQKSQPHGQERLSVCQGERPREAHWETEPNVGRVVDGIPNRTHRIKALGNSVVPQVAKQIGEMILDTDN
jgi:DNA (cytosine-5)-methyltransferase 1